VTMALRNSRNTRRATGSCELTSILLSITGLPPHAFSSIYLFALSELLGATTLAKLPVTYYHTS
jgi:hypothetical protein